MKRYVIEEIGTASSDEEDVRKKTDGCNLTLEDDKTLDQINGATNICLEKNGKFSDSRLPTTVAENTECLKTGEVHDQPLAEVPPPNTCSTTTSSAPSSLNFDLFPPVSSLQFETTWKRLEKTPDLQYKYMKVWNVYGR